MTTTVVNLGVSNLGSVVNMLRRIGHEPAVTDDPDEVRAATSVVLPGVGHFDAGMERLRHRGLDQALRDAAGAGARILGICLGMQLLGESSEEGSSRGLSLLPMVCRRLPRSVGDSTVRVPHMGWNSVRFSPGNGLVDAEEEWRFYFVHSYAVCDDAVAVGTTRHGVEFASVVRSGSVFGVQFHPEKSHRFGMKLLDSFVSGTQQC